METTFLDRAVAMVSPRLALERIAARGAMETAQATPPAGLPVSALDDRNAPPYEGNFFSRIFRSSPRDAKVDTMLTLRYDRAASRELARTSPIAAGAINTNVDRIVGTGLALSAQPNLAVLGWTREQGLAWKRKVQNEFSLWADSTESDQSQSMNFYEQQALVLRSMLESGDCFTLLPDGKASATQPYRLRVQVVEADRVGNPSGLSDSPLISGGVKTNEAGAPTEYHFYDRHPGGTYQAGAAGNLYAGRWIERVGPRSGRRRVLHHLRKKRPDQPRGLPYLAAIIQPLQQISRYTEGEIMAAVMTSYLTVFVKQDKAQTSPVYDGGPLAPDSPVSNEVGLGQGAMVNLAPGETIETVDPNRPNPNFGPFIDAVLTQIGMALSLPFELLVKKFQSSYSASKAALNEAGVYFRTSRNWLALSFCQPVYETWLAEAVATGRISAPSFFTDPLMRWAYTRAAWPGDSMGSINPKDEVAAYTAAIDARIMTRERAEWELGGTDWNDTFDVKASEEARLKAADMLPVPKAGAPAPSPASGAKPPQPPAPPESLPGENNEGNE
jgi:lambda family phage portal protein